MLIVSRRLLLNTRAMAKYSSKASAADLEKTLRTVQEGNCLIVELNRPKALNALSIEMCLEMKDLLQYQINGESSSVGAFIMKGVGGKAFCAGGDVKSIWQELIDNGPPSDEIIGGKGLLHSDFFRDEYIMDYMLGTSLRPQISLWDGIVMGGGVGISMLGAFRVATEKTMFAMPETGSNRAVE
jgi:enoyl-CoA hydratase/carnithine racemase